MTFGIVNFPGSTGVNDLCYALQEMLDQKVVIVWHKDTVPSGIDILILPAGSSFGDDLRPGAMARFSPVMDSIIQYTEKGGVVLGISNGFQILCEAGLLPGTFLLNDSLIYTCKSCHIKADNNHSLINRYVEKEKVLKIPVSIKYGRYYVDEGTLIEMRQNDQITYRYCNEYGKSTERSNPGGAVENIAGICNAEKNIYGIIPVPERAVDDELGNTDGKLIFQSFL